MWLMHISIWIFIFLDFGLWLMQSYCSIWWFAIFICLIMMLEIHQSSHYHFWADTDTGVKGSADAEYWSCTSAKLICNVHCEDETRIYYHIQFLESGSDRNLIQILDWYISTWCSPSFYWLSEMSPYKSTLSFKSMFLLLVVSHLKKKKKKMKDCKCQWVKRQCWHP